jgi:hypothetical protein
MDRPLDPVLPLQGQRRSTSINPSEHDPDPKGRVSATREPVFRKAHAHTIKIGLNGEDFLFLGREQLIDLRNRPVGRLLHVIGQTLLIVLGNLVILFKLLDGIETIAPDMPDRDAGGLGVFVRDFDQFLATILVEFTWPSVAGLKPRLESTIAFSTALTIDLSHTCTESSLGSGTLMVAS